MTSATRDRPLAVRRIALAALVGWGLAAVATAADERQRARGVRLANEGRCQSALADLDAAREAEPGDVQVVLLAGQCRFRLHRYAEAARDLEAAALLSPDRADIWLALAKARYHEGRFSQAEIDLERAAPGLPDDAELWLYRGMLELERGAFDAAATSLERARSLDPERVEPVASYYLGVAHGQVLDVKAATPAFTRVSDSWRGTDWSIRADQQLQRLGADSARHVWVSAGAGFEYDSNVVLAGRNVALPEEISDEADELGVWTANAGIELWKNANVTVGAMASYRGTTHVDLDEFDTHFPSVTTWVDVLVGESMRASARYDFGYAWLDNQPFVATNSWEASLARGWARAGFTELFGRALLDDYFQDGADVSDDCSGGSVCGPLGLDESEARRRSGWGLGGGLAHTVPIPTGDLPIDRVSVRAAYEFGHFDAEGRDYSFNSHDFQLGLTAGLPLGVDFGVSGSFAYEPYRFPSTYPNATPIPGVPYSLSSKKRLDKVWRAQTSLTSSITDELSVSASWRYIDNQSNTDVFDYDRHVVGLYFNVGLGREL